MCVLLILSIVCGPAAKALSEAQPPLTAATLPQFLAQYEKTIASVAEAFGQLEKQNLPLLDESGRPLGRRTIRDRTKEISGLRGDMQRLAAKPEDLVLTLTFLSHTEGLADDVYDVSQIAYDNDQEELGKQLTDLLSSLDRDEDSIQDYALDLAARKQRQIENLEQLNRSLEQKMKKPAATTQRSEKPGSTSAAIGEHCQSSILLSQATRAAMKQLCSGAIAAF